jgi:hypothetical protein
VLDEPADLPAGGDLQVAPLKALAAAAVLATGVQAAPSKGTLKVLVVPVIVTAVDRAGNRSLAASRCC